MNSIEYRKKFLSMSEEEQRKAVRSNRHQYSSRVFDKLTEVEKEYYYEIQNNRMLNKINEALLKEINNNKER